MIKNRNLHTEPTRESLQILYEDNHVIAVHKPAGVLVQGDRSGDVSLMDVVKEHLKGKYQKPGNVFLGLVHRLDRPVSGVVLFARTSKAASRLSAQWRERKVKKIYWALVHGNLQPEQGELRSYLRSGRKRASRGAEGEEAAREASLSYRTLAGRRDISLVEILLHTGRKHQIRAQLAQAGCPIWGDFKYGGAALAEQGIRLAARSLTFTHPTLGEEITIESPPPDWAREFLTGS